MKRKYLLLLIISVAVIVLDQVTKLAVLKSFRLGESIILFDGFFNLTYVRNTGAAFGILAEAHPDFRVPFFLLVPLIALSAIGYIFRRIPDHDWKLAIALAMVVGGAIGNLIDRIAYGYVVDFLDFHWKYGYHFPAFNLADSAICVGVGILMLDLLRNPETPETQGEKRSDASGSV
jgi:signal peptidase II